jgi:methylated-DNA-protein-cysteine methyltransferase-like protein
MRGDYVAAVCAVVAHIPPGRVLSYGDIAELLESGGPRQAGAAIGGAPAGTPWWRVVRADGTLPPVLAGKALSCYLAEGTALVGVSGQDGAAVRRVDMRRARWSPSDSELIRLSALRREVSVPHDEVKA